jgi:hypothetical protein
MRAEVRLFALYLVCLFLGGTLILASILLGGGQDHGDAGDHDGGLHLKDFPVDKALDLVKDLPVMKDLPVDKTFDLVKDLAKDVPHDATPVADGQTPIEQTVGSHHPSSGGDLGGPGLKALVSLRFWTFALASFGFLGAGLHVIGIGEPVAALVAAPVSAVLGYVAAYIFWKLSRSEVGLATTLGQLRGAEAEVVLPIRVGGTGKVALKVSGQYTELLARTNDAAELGMRDRVLVVSIDEGVATVTSIRARRS